jgi:hypothetical protein
MPRLRELVLGQADAGSLGALLEDASGCGELQRLELTLADPGAWERALDAAAAAAALARGLAALTGGACSGSLQALALVPAVPQAQGCWVCGVEQVAALLGGALPRLQSLRLEVRVEAGRLAGGVASAGAAAPAAGRGQALPGREAEWWLAALGAQLRMQGVLGEVRGPRLAGEVGMRWGPAAGCLSRPGWAAASWRATCGRATSWAPWVGAADDELRCAAQVARRV